CSPATTPRSPGGAVPSRSGAPRAAVPTCSRPCPRGRSPTPNGLRSRVTDHPRVRAQARVIVRAPAVGVLLFGARLVDLSQPPGPVLYWYTPGGEIERGESVR